MKFFAPPTFRCFPELETARLWLTEIKPAYTEDIFRHFSDHEVTRYLDLAPLQTPQDAQHLVNFLTNRFKEERGIRWGIRPKGQTHLIGTCGYNFWAKRRARAELGYDLAPAYWRQGLATEAVKAVIAFGFETMRLWQIEAFIAPKNIASQQFIKRLGFRQARNVREFQFSTGQLASMTVFSLDKEQWVNLGESSYFYLQEG